MKDYTDLSMTELTDLLKDRFLPTDGLKDSLISRLEAYDAVNDPSPSPELHVSPAIPPAQIHKLAPTSIPNHLPNELDEEYCLNWDDADDDDEDDAAKAITISKAAEATKAPEATESKPPKVAEDSLTQPEPNPVPTAARGHSSQPSVHPSVSPASVERVTKSGYKYKSIAATFFPDLPGPSAAVPSNYSTPTKAFLKPPSTTPAAPVKNVTGSPCGVSPTTPSKAISKPLPSAPPNTLSKTPALSTEDDSAPITPTPVIATASSSAMSKPPTLSNSSSTTTTTTTTTAATQEKATPESTINASRVKTTKSGYQFNSIASLFPSPPKAVTATPTKPTSSSIKPQKIANSVTDANSTYPRSVKRGPEEEAQKLAKRATRFGVTTKEAEALASSKLKKHSRSTQSSAAEERNVKEKERKTEIEKEMERERIRQRVTSTKRQRNEDDDDRHPDYQHRYNRQSQYRSPGTRANYYPRWRY